MLPIESELIRRYEVYKEALQVINADRQTIQARKAAIAERDQFESDLRKGFLDRVFLAPVVGGREFRRCDFCLVWATKPCGEGCCWSADGQTVEEHKADVENQWKCGCGGWQKLSTLGCHRCGKAKPADAVDPVGDRDLDTSTRA